MVGLLVRLKNLFPTPLRRRLWGVWHKAERHLPLALRSVFWNDLNLIGRPTLGYLEAHLVDHCNLNCHGCSHFSPLAPHHLVALDDFTRHLARLGDLFRTIRVIRLMGGEPLLHPEVAAFLGATHAQFPAARIYLVTNGLLLGKMGASFWKACRQSRVTLDLTVYPPLAGQTEVLRELCRSQGVPLRESPNSAFYVRLVEKASVDQAQAFSFCRNLYYCPLLKGDRLYVCATSAYIGLFNAAFGRDLPQSTGIPIYGDAVTGRSLIRALNRPAALCRHCPTELRAVPWENGASCAEHWLLGQEVLR